MICRNCKTNSNRIKVIDGKDYCSNCAELTATGGSHIDGSITRNSFRIREQQKQYQADLTPAWVYDKHSKKVKANKDFVQMFPEQASKTYTDKELKDVGVTKIKSTI